MVPCGPSPPLPSFQKHLLGPVRPGCLSPPGPFPTLGSNCPQAPFRSPPKAGCLTNSAAGLGVSPSALEGFLVGKSGREGPKKKLQLASSLSQGPWPTLRKQPSLPPPPPTALHLCQPLPLSLQCRFRGPQEASVWDWKSLSLLPFSLFLTLISGRLSSQLPHQMPLLPTAKGGK